MKNLARKLFISASLFALLIGAACTPKVPRENMEGYTTRRDTDSQIYLTQQDLLDSNEFAKAQIISNKILQEGGDVPIDFLGVGQYRTQYSRKMLDADFLYLTLYEAIQELRQNNPNKIVELDDQLAKQFWEAGGEFIERSVKEAREIYGLGHAVPYAYGVAGNRGKLGIPVGLGGGKLPESSPNSEGKPTNTPSPETATPTQETKTPEANQEAKPFPTLDLSEPQYQRHATKPELTPTSPELRP